MKAFKLSDREFLDLDKVHYAKYIPDLWVETSSMTGGGIAIEVGVPGYTLTFGTYQHGEERIEQLWAAIKEHFESNSSAEIEKRLRVSEELFGMKPGELSKDLR